MFNAMIEVLKANPRKIVFTEGHDARILEAASRLKKDGFLTPILVGNVEEVKAAIEACQPHDKLILIKGSNSTRLVQAVPLL